MRLRQGEGQKEATRLAARYTSLHAKAGSEVHGARS
jgi:hypothetical protein